MRLLGVLAFSLCLCCAAARRADAQLYEQDPFDQITLDEANNNATLRVKPLDLPGRRLPAKPEPTDKLVLRLADRPEKQYEVLWGSITKVELFEDMLLAKANELLAAGQLDEAYGYLRFLEENYPGVANLAAASEAWLFRQAGVFYGKQQYRNALAVLRELHRRDPQHPKLESALGATTEKLVDEYAAAGDDPSIRALVRQLSGWYPGHPLVEKWQTRLKDQAAAELTAARAAVGAGDLRKASASLRRAAHFWPELEGARQLAQEVHAKYPRVVVGVCDAEAVGEGKRGQSPFAGTAQRVLRTNGDCPLFPGGARGDLLTDWAARRDDRLVCRMLAELADAGPQGGSYRCPVGEIKVEEGGRKISVQLHHDVRFSSPGATLSGYDVARRLLVMADPAAAAYRADWARLLDAVAVHGGDEVEIELRAGHVCPQAMLETPLFSYTAGYAPQDRRTPLAGPYVRAETAAAETVYLPNGRYFAAVATQPQEIVQRRFPAAAAAAAALRRGEIDLLDRLAPWQVKSLAADAEVVVQAYALPRVYCLIPNLRRPLTANRTFRRALVYGIDRPAILAELLWSDRRPGCAVLHGPFPQGDSPEDPLSYAADPELKPRPYDPRLAVALAEAGRREAAGASQVPPQSHALVLGFPKGEVARTACAAIRRQLAAIDVAVELQELDPGSAAAAEVDLLYVELALWEPVVDAPRVLGEEGLARGCSAAMSQALGQLAAATRWSDVVARLHRIDRVAHDEVAVVPLWQLTDSFAYRKGFEGIKAKTLSLYQDVEHWKPAFSYPTDK
jgi:ABC-type transport system substrate-binding protein